MFTRFDAEEVRHPRAFHVIEIILNVQFYMGAWAWNEKRNDVRRTDVVPPLGSTFTNQ